MIIFLDVGTHDGHTLKEIISYKYNFDKIYGFEPCLKQFRNASNEFSNISHLEMYNFGLSNFTCKTKIYGSNNNLGASIFQNKNDVEKNISEDISLVSASDFFKENIPLGSIIIMKLNCEGAEIPILNDLVDSGEIHKLSNVLIDFDSRKIPGMENSESLLLKRFKDIGFVNFSLSDKFIGCMPTHQERIGAWLKSINILEIYK
jgi:FkbM family methyltransferase